MASQLCRKKEQSLRCPFQPSAEAPAAGRRCRPGAKGDSLFPYGRRSPTSLTSGGTTVTYRYSLGGQRTFKQNGANDPQYYVLDGSTTLAVVTGSSLDYWNVVRPDGTAIGRHTAGGGRRYYRTDHLGSVRAVIDPSGTTLQQKVVETRDYFPFGLHMEGRNATTAGDAAKEDFTGHERDSETSLHYAGARYYMSALGRWTTTDPILDGDPRPLLGDQRQILLGTSPYNYSLNNPTNLRDPDGRCPVCLVVWAAAEVGLAAYDAYNAYQTYNDPNATPEEKADALRMATIGAVGPGGGYTALAKKYDELAAGARAWYQKAFYLGKAGETRVQAAYGFTKKQSQKTIQLDSFTSKSGSRRVDFMSAEHGMVEVKNVSGTLPFTKQLRDFADYAAEKGIDLTIVIPDGTDISKPLREAIEDGRLTIKTFDEIKN